MFPTLVHTALQGHLALQVLVRMEQAVRVVRPAHLVMALPALLAQAVLQVQVNQALQEPRVRLVHLHLG